MSATNPMLKKISGFLQTVRGWSEQRIFRNILIALTIITVLLIYLPTMPRMPNAGLDMSWQYAMNEAVAQDLVIGRDIIFTFGPYASVYSHLYHAPTDQLKITASILLAIGHLILLLYLALPDKPWRLFFYLLFLVPFTYLRDPLLMSYPILFALALGRYLETARDKNQKHRIGGTIIAILLAALMGILPLIKGSLLILCAGMIVLMAVYAVLRARAGLAAGLVGGMLVGTVLSWICVGQPLDALLGYVRMIGVIAGGYTEAMAVSGSVDDILLFLVAATVTIWAIIKYSEVSFLVRTYRFFVIGLFLFVAWKSGYVRQDGHVYIAATLLVFTALFAGFSQTDRRMTIATTVCLVAWTYIAAGEMKSVKRTPMDNVRSTFAMKGLKARIAKPKALPTLFQKATARIVQSHPLPQLEGTVDFYSRGQAILFASGFQWNPRPILQSYTAYTPQLARINERHVRGSNAPDHVLMVVQPIDERFPTLEDGLSWPALLDNYSVREQSKKIAVLDRKPTIKTISTWNPILDDQFQVGTVVKIPEHSDPLFAQIRIRPTLFGRILTLLYKPPPLRMDVTLNDGTQKKYDIPSGLIEAGFFLSPLVEDTAGFVKLAGDDLELLQKARVTQIEISIARGGQMFWQSQFQLTLDAYQAGIQD